MKKLIAMLAGFILAFMPVAAQAHAFNIYQGEDYAHVGTEHKYLWVYDRECDGHRVYATIDYGNWKISSYDSNGCAQGGEQMAIGEDAEWARVSEYNDDNGDWYRSDWWLVAR